MFYYSKSLSLTIKLWYKSYTKWENKDSYIILINLLSFAIQSTFEMRSFNFFSQL